MYDKTEDHLDRDKRNDLSKYLWQHLEVYPSISRHLNPNIYRKTDQEKMEAGNETLAGPFVSHIKKSVDSGEVSSAEQLVQFNACVCLKAL